MPDKIQTVTESSATQREFKNIISEKLDAIPGFEKIKEIYKKALFKEIVANESHKKLPREEKKEVALWECPFPKHKWYVDVWNTLTPEQKKDMKDNIRITTDGKIEIIKMKKKFSPLTAKPNGDDIFDGSHIDKWGNTGIKGVTYLTGEAAERQVKRQWKKLLKDLSEVEQFVSFFPGENTKEKIFNFVRLFGLEKAGYWDPDDKEWSDVNVSGGCVALSYINENYDVYEIQYYTNTANVNRYNRAFPCPFLAFEKC